MAAGGPLLALVGFIVFPLVWSVPEALVTAELATAFPENSGYVAWVTAAFGPYWGFQARLSATFATCMCHKASEWCMCSHPLVAAGRGQGAARWHCWQPVALARVCVVCSLHGSTLLGVVHSAAACAICQHCTAFVQRKSNMTVWRTTAFVPSLSRNS